MKIVIKINNELKKDIEKNRKFWEKIAKQNKWYSKPFYIQCWIKNNKVTDSVSYDNLKEDVLIFESMKGGLTK